MSENRGDIPKEVRAKITALASQIEEAAGAFLKKFEKSRSRVTASKELMPILRMMGELEKLFHTDSCKHPYKDMELLAKHFPSEDGVGQYVEFCVNAETGRLVKIHSKAVYPVPPPVAAMMGLPALMKPVSRHETSLEEMRTEYGITPKVIAECIQHQTFMMSVHGTVTQAGAEA